MTFSHTVFVPLRERQYPIFIASGSLKNLPDLPPEALPGEIALFSNATLDALYGEAFAALLQAQGQRVIRVTLGDGEKNKSLETAARAFDSLAENGFGRSGAIWALGGGVCGDLAGFVAATWMRGVSFVQVPTTLLAMVDSSVGGKVGINHPRAKNLLGAFWQPRAVLIDPDTLGSLPPREWAAGMAEVIKYGVIADAQFFEFLEANLEAIRALDAATITHVIARCCTIKAEVVGDDERENDTVGRRAILNYGHTSGHGFEALSDYGALLHGEAIAIGMTLEARLSALLGFMDAHESRDLIERQTRLFQACGLPTRAPAQTDFEALWRAMTLDKKNRGGQVHFIVPTRLGQVTRISAQKADFEAVLNAP